jgi:hypothetical protein
MKFKIICVAILALSVSYLSNGALAQTLAPDPKTPEIHIGRNGKTTIEGLRVVQIANTTIFGRTTWDESFIRWTIKTDAKTDIKKRFGDSIKVSDLKDGDYLSIEGSVEGGNSISIIATKIINWSDYTSISTYSGLIKRIDEVGKKITVSTARGLDIVVTISPETVVYRNKREINSNYLKIGDKVSDITGLYNSSTGVMAASKIFTEINPSIFAEQNYQGKLITVPNPNVSPVTFSVEINGKEYTVILNSGYTVLNSKREKTTFTRFLAGDTIRLWGAIRSDDDELSTIYADLVRNLNF